MVDKRIRKTGVPATPLNLEAIRVRKLIKRTEGFCFQDSALAPEGLPAFESLRKKFRIGHLDTLRYVEIPRKDLIDKTKITLEWLYDFEEYAVSRANFTADGYPICY